MKDTIKIAKHGVRMIAHRGLSGIETQNTAAAFIAAGNRSYYGIETDIHRTADGRYVCMHDATTANVAGRDISVLTSTYEDILKVKLNDFSGGSGPRADLVAPLLEDYISICKCYSKQAVLELKDNFGRREIDEIVSIIDGLGYLDHVTFISFHPLALLRMRKALPDTPCQLLTDRTDDRTIEGLVKYDLGLDAYYPALTEERVKCLKSHKIAVNCWTVDTAADAERLAEWGVDFITSNILE